ncbi:hypothetical protein RhiirB3_442502, partial [Rhizophagus irregularis]
MDICEIIPSIRNKHKINVHGFIMVKDKNRNYMYYWYCEKRDMLNCKGRATTILTEDQHHLVKATDHNHAAEANRVKVIKAIKLLKERSQQSNNNPVQVIQSIVAGTSQDAYPYLPSRDALRQMDLTVGEEKVLIFTTTSNIKYLAQSNFWLADRTFKTVPTIFRQLYTIHGSIGSNENSRIMPLVIQSIVAGTSQDVYPYLLSRDAFRQTVKQIRHINYPIEPQSLDQLIIPKNMRKILNGSDFLIKDLTVCEEKVLIFTTTSNIKYLAQLNFWLADRTFKTVSTIFRQLYTIHGSIRSNENSQIMPLVYALMLNKSEVAYRALFQELIDFSYEHDVDLQLQFIITDFEIIAINAIRAEFQGVQNKGYHFHLSQNIYRKVQELGLT